MFIPAAENLLASNQNSQSLKRLGKDIDWKPQGFETEGKREWKKYGKSIKFSLFSVFHRKKKCMNPKIANNLRVCLCFGWWKLFDILNLPEDYSTRPLKLSVCSGVVYLLIKNNFHLYNIILTYMCKFYIYNIFTILLQIIYVHLTTNHPFLSTFHLCFAIDKLLHGIEDVQLAILVWEECAASGASDRSQQDSSCLHTCAHCPPIVNASVGICTKWSLMTVTTKLNMLGCVEVFLCCILHTHQPSGFGRQYFHVFQ